MLHPHLPPQNSDPWGRGPRAREWCEWGERVSGASGAGSTGVPKVHRF